MILAAQYERWNLPIAVLLAVPFAVFGAISANWLRGMANDVYFQIALVTLIGLAAKNAILIVEFAMLKLEEGLSLADAAIAAARLRFRPIIMTSLAFVLGCVPLAISTGAGAVLAPFDWHRGDWRHAGGHLYCHVFHSDVVHADHAPGPSPRAGRGQPA